MRATETKDNNCFVMSAKSVLYLNQNKTDIVGSSAISESEISKAKLWHLRIGHLPIYKLHLIFPDLDGKAANERIICSICPQAKQTRNIYPKSCCKSLAPLDLLHIDILGAFQILH